MKNQNKQINSIGSQDKKLKSSNITGVNMIELLITIVVMAILIGIAVPSYNIYIANNKAEIVADVLNSTLRLAKSEALQRATPIKICGADTTPGVCNDNATNWTYGWQIILASTGEVLHNYAPSGSEALSINPTSSIFYLPSGLPSPQAFTFSIKPASCTHGYVINYDALSSGGSLQTTTISCP